MSYSDIFWILGKSKKYILHFNERKNYLNKKEYNIKVQVHWWCFIDGLMQYITWWLRRLPFSSAKVKLGSAPLIWDDFTKTLSHTA